MTKCVSLGCECSDPGCNHTTPELEAKEYDSADLNALIRVDMADDSQIYFCPHCTDDALASGVFAIDEEY